MILLNQLANQSVNQLINQSVYHYNHISLRSFLDATNEQRNLNKYII